MTSMTDSSSQYFTRVASDWDEIRKSFFNEEMRNKAIEHAYLRPEMVVADVGAGTGFITEGIAPLVRRVYALAASASMLDQARQKLDSKKNVVFKEADGLNLPLPDDCLDAVFANMYLHHCPDPQAAIREMTRVLRPGGRLVITDMDTHPYEWVRQEMADFWLGFERPLVKSWFRQAGMVNTLVKDTEHT